MKTMSRGYAIPYHDGKIVRSVAGLEPGDALNLRLTDGVLGCRVETCLQGDAES